MYSELFQNSHRTSMELLFRFWNNPSSGFLRYFRRSAGCLLHLRGVFSYSASCSPRCSHHQTFQKFLGTSFESLWPWCWSISALLSRQQYTATTSLFPAALDSEQWQAVVFACFNHFHDYFLSKWHFGITPSFACTRKWPGATQKD